MNAFISRVHEIEEMREKNLLYNFVERSVYTDKNVFTLTIRMEILMKLNA